MSGQLDRWIRWTTTGCVGLLALIAGTVSYLHMHELVTLHGQPGWVAARGPGLRSDPAAVGFATKPQLALDMIIDAVAAGTPAAWVASDEFYGDNGAFRAGVAKLGLGYALAVSCDHRGAGLAGRETAPAGRTDSWAATQAGHGSRGSAGSPRPAG